MRGPWRTGLDRSASPALEGAVDRVGDAAVAGDAEVGARGREEPLGRAQLAFEIESRQPHRSEGADEVDLVNSGLEETMVTAYNEINDIAKEKDTDLRTAAFICAIDKVAVAYLEMGIFP